MLRWLVRLQLAPQIPGRRPLLFPDGRSRAVLRSLLVIGGSRLGHSSSSAPSRSSFSSSPAAAAKVEPARSRPAPSGDASGQLRGLAYWGDRHQGVVAHSLVWIPIMVPYQLPERGPATSNATSSIEVRRSSDG